VGTDKRKERKEKHTKDRSYFFHTQQSNTIKPLMLNNLLSEKLFLYLSNVCGTFLNV